MLDVLAFTAYLLLATAGVIVVVVAAAAPSARPPTLGLRGLHRARARHRAWFRALEPVLCWTAARIAALGIVRLRAKIDERLAAAGDRLGITADEWLALAVLAAVAAGGAILPLVVGGVSPFAVPVSALAAFMAMYVALDAAAARRRRDVVRALPTAVDLIGLCVSAGMSTRQAITELLSAWPLGEEEPLGEELRIVERQLALGHPRKVVLDELARRVPAEEVHDLVAAVNQAESKGTPLGEVLTAQATAARQRYAYEVEHRAAGAAMKMMAPLALLLLATLVVVLAPLAISAGEWL